MKTVEEIKHKLIYLKLDILEFLGNIEMFIKRLTHRTFYNSLSIDDIPKNTFYCYDGCRLIGIESMYSILESKKQRVVIKKTKYEYAQSKLLQWKKRLLNAKNKNLINRRG